MKYKHTYLIKDRFYSLDTAFSIAGIKFVFLIIFWFKRQWISLRSQEYEKFWPKKVTDLR